MLHQHYKLLGHRLRRWPNLKSPLDQCSMDTVCTRWADLDIYTSRSIVPTLGERLVFANTRRSPNVGTVLAHRLRRWPNIEPTLGELHPGSHNSVHTNTITAIYRAVNKHSGLVIPDFSSVGSTHYTHQGWTLSQQKWHRISTSRR